MKTRTKAGLSIMAIILSVALLFTMCYTMGSTTAVNSEASLRTVALSNECYDGQNVYEQFDEHSITTEGSVTYFEGYKTFDEKDLRETDCIVDENLDEQNDYQVKYNLSYDNDSNIVTIKVEAQNERGDIDVDEMQGTTFVNEKGEIDAIMNINGKTVLLSELLKDDIINNCGWLSRLIKQITVIILPVVPVVIHIVEESYAISNREHNKKLNEPNDYINNQGAYREWKFGIKSNIADMGCGVIAIYNVMRKLGKPQSLADVIFACDSKSGDLFFGHGGVDFTHFREYFYSHYIAVNMHCGFKSMKSALESMPTNKMAIVSYWTNSQHTQGHYIAVEKFVEDGVTKFNCYNNGYSARPDTIEQIVESYFDYGLINGFIIG